MSYYDDLYSESEPQDEQVQNPVEEELEPDTYVSRQPKPRKNVGKKILAAILVVALIAGSCVLTAVLVNNHWQQEMDLMNQRLDQKILALQKEYGAGAYSTAAPSAGELMTPGEIYAQNLKAVVAVNGLVSNGIMEGYSTGTGFLISKNGYVVTNYHVVDDAKSVKVTLYDETQYDAKVVGYEAANDVAVLKIEGENFHYATLGKSADLRVGDQVVVIGNALGTFVSSLTVGYVSGMDRIVNTDGTAMNMLQTDAAINAGNSGGPLFNMRGEVVGITTAKFSGQYSGVGIEGLSLAVPMDDVVGMIEDICRFGYVTGAYLGVYILDVDANAQYFGLPAGAYIDGTMDGFAAQKGGIKAQDIVVELGGYEVSSVSDLTRVLRKFKPGETVVVRVYRGGQYVQLLVTLDERPQETKETPAEPAAPTQQEKDQFEEFYGNFFG